MTPTAPAPTWFKSSYSSNEGPNCIEVALDWRKSSHSGNDGPDCVEVAIASPGATVHIRDSKNKNGAQVAVDGAAWAPFIGFAAGSQTV
ncbi:DUF397 domain-containing protein [Streptomyces spectabilis]|uniref:DUF397 domain-containing protein n=1 Tax=Streptomyces spectabilis TaxID=68270 RepID=A0A516R8Z0_STRST|nr:DUF397 domain-containing protein [Streptomyces spectabilis]QDQ12113.1 DUF397 domain-containing protein [Streptomyces spectabilis]